MLYNKWHNIRFLWYKNKWRKECKMKDIKTFENAQVNRNRIPTAECLFCAISLIFEWYHPYRSRQAALAYILCLHSKSLGRANMYVKNTSPQSESVYGLMSRLLNLEEVESSLLTYRQWHWWAQKHFQKKMNTGQLLT